MDTHFGVYYVFAEMPSLAVKERGRDIVCMLYLNSVIGMGRYINYPPNIGFQ